MTRAAIDDVLLDHVAHAVPRWQDVWPRYAVDLGATWSSGGLATGFAPGQVEFANGARLELLMPNDTGTNDFLERFLVRNGPGPHHLTFKVPDLGLALDQARRAGYEPIGIDLRDPEWMEAFIHPKQATGVVVQLAQAANGWTCPPPADFPVDRRQRGDGTGPTRPASLRWVTHAVAEPETATPLFVALLGGEVTGEGIAPGHRWTELTWGGPIGLRLVSPVGASGTPLRQWLGGRAGRVHHLEFSVEDPGGIPGARPDDRSSTASASASASGIGTGTGTDTGPGTYWVLPPGDNAGMRLALRAE
jgi:methylmalonyl-CoA/ethylmalonyl-CoA epimerase